MRSFPSAVPLRQSKDEMARRRSTLNDPLGKVLTPSFHNKQKERRYSLAITAVTKQVFFSSSIR